MRQQKGATGYTSYVLGHTPTELQRLVMQGQFLGEPTLEVLARAAIDRGMPVLDRGDRNSGTIVRDQQPPPVNS